MQSAELRRDDLKWCVNKLPRRLRDLMKENPNKIAVGGGYIRDRIAGVKPNDIDLFVTERDDAIRFAAALASETDRVIKTKNAVTVAGPTIPIQLIHRWTYEHPSEIAESFDFTIAMGVIWYGGAWRSSMHPDFYADLAARRLIYTSPDRNEDAGGSILRVLKFYQRGYRIPLQSLGAVVARLAQGVDNIGGMDEGQLAYVFSGLLREVDPSIDPEGLAYIPDDEPDEDEEADPAA